MTVVAVFTVGTFPKKNINQCLIVFVFPRVPRRRDSGAIGFLQRRGLGPLLCYVEGLNER